ncbi:MAG: hypothetical protein HOB67_00550, partial [Acidimicrobiaceae bacterium]|nr:hypothetical protein [Acidimicrobiaceae bacterium]
MPDLYFSAVDEATDAEKMAVDEAISDWGPVTIRVSERLVTGGRARARERRHLLL